MISAAADIKNAVAFIKNAILQRILLKNIILNAADISEMTNATIVTGMEISSIPRAETATLIRISAITETVKHSAETIIEIIGMILFTCIVYHNIFSLSRGKRQMLILRTKKLTTVSVREYNITKDYLSIWL